MWTKNNFFENQWNDSFKAFWRGTLLCVAFFIGLALLIFIFPWFVGFLFASLLLTIGVTALAFGYHVKKLSHLPVTLLKVPNYVEARVGNPCFYGNRTYYGVRSYWIRH